MKHFILFMIELAVKSGIESSLLTNREWYSLLMHMLKKVTQTLYLYTLLMILPYSILMNVIPKLPIPITKMHVCPHFGKRKVRLVAFSR